MKIGQLEINLDELAEFIVKGKKHGYAGGGKYKKMEDGSKLFTFQDGYFHYEDRFWGSVQAPGRELVRWKNENGQGIWFMAYSGGMLPEFWGNEKLAEETFEFLKEALLLVTPQYPFRGPHRFREETLLYDNHSNGDLKRFFGKEEIIDMIQFKEIFSQDYIGGLIIPK